MGRMYQHGEGIEKDDNLAAKWYRMAAEQGSVVAMLDLGNMYEHIGPEIEYLEEAARLYQRAADKGSPEGMTRLAGLCRRLWRWEEAEQLYLAAIGKGYVRAKLELAEFYISMYDGLNKREQVEMLAKEAANAGVVGAKHFLATYNEFVRKDEYWGGLAMDREGNYAEAAKHFLAVAKRGDSESQFMLGCYYDNGTGVEKDPAQAFKWYLAAAEQGHASSQYTVGFCYDHGTGVGVNYQLAFRWYLAAAKQGNTNAKDEVGVSFGTGRGVTQDWEQAFKWFSEAAAEGNTNSMCNLAVMYKTGYYVEIDLKKAEEWALRAEEAGDKHAKQLLGNIRSKMTRL